MRIGIAGAVIIIFILLAVFSLSSSSTGSLNLVNILGKLFRISSAVLPDLVVSDIASDGDSLQVTVANSGKAQVTFSTDSMELAIAPTGLGPNPFTFCVAGTGPDSGKCVDNPLLATKVCTQKLRGSCVFKNPITGRTTCTCSPRFTFQTITLLAGKSTIISMPDVGPVTGNEVSVRINSDGKIRESNTNNNILTKSFE